MNQLLFVLMGLVLFSCAGAGILETSDPQEKLRQAYTLIPMGRSLMAEKLIGDAIVMFKKKGNTVEVARSYLVYGDLYKSGRTHGDLILPDKKKSAHAYQTAAEIYQTVGYSNYQTMALWLSGSLYGDAGEKALACRNLAVAKKAYNPNAVDKENFRDPKAILKKISDSQIENRCR